MPRTWSRAVCRLMEVVVMPFSIGADTTRGGEATFGYDCGRDPR
jgi:hypothetical protein